jgi:putative ABC transport system substrate-binding protein
MVFFPFMSKKTASDRCSLVRRPVGRENATDPISVPTTPGVWASFCPRPVTSKVAGSSPVAPATAMEGKRLGLLREMVPNVALIGVLLNPAMATFDGQVSDVQAAAGSVGQRLHILRASNDGEIDAAFAKAAELRTGGLLVAADPFLSSRREHLVALAARYAIPAIYEWRDFVEAGGLMSYGTDLTEAYRLAGIYAGRILKGDKPADLPVQQTTKVELFINLKTAKALGITVPLPLSGRADEIFE